ncbi:NAD-dependent protein deacetylase [Robbsia sp. Bb-Pol-6]|uniref:protein acetyllysine N-acetyltransferase n=1 Tax=Robbsia betulipollinis TaxID=2981849 RepID=A0ABT3ZHD8_9BURK|nr:NAD-dependent protein deacetylase [Robbsia betulipollinis]MCY0385951.1 NAD-dependent protein deacetylase [Robbsia betulipollinis]
MAEPVHEASHEASHEAAHEAAPHEAAREAAQEAAALDRLADFVDRHPRLFVLTGAGCSTESGIEDYRDANGDWKRPMPTTYQAFTTDTLMRNRYWARGMIGWRGFGRARPNAAHAALAHWEHGSAGHDGDRSRPSLLVTQNVDGLHEAAGSRNVIDLHGRLDRVRCLACDARFGRDAMQADLERCNPAWIGLDARLGPDGDADLEDAAFADFVVPTHAGCGGMLKPDVVFFGEPVPRERVDRAFAALDASDGMLVVGSSLMVYSGYRFALGAAERGLPIAAINIGRTRADALLDVKVEASAARVLARLFGDAF